MLLAAITIQEEKKRCLTPRFKKTKKAPGSSRSAAASQASESTLSSTASTVSASEPTKKEVFVVIKADQNNKKRLTKSGMPYWDNETDLRDKRIAQEEEFKR